MGVQILSSPIEKARAEHNECKSHYFIEQCDVFSKLDLPTLEEPGKGLHGGTLDADNVSVADRDWLDWINDGVLTFRQQALDGKGETAFRAVLDIYHIKFGEDDVQCRRCLSDTVISPAGCKSIAAKSRIFCDRCKFHPLCRGCIQELEDREDWAIEVKDGLSLNSMKCPSCRKEDGFVDAKLPPIRGNESLYILGKVMKDTENELCEEFLLLSRILESVRKLEKNWRNEKVKLAKGWGHEEDVESTSRKHAMRVD